MSPFYIFFLGLAGYWYKNGNIYPDMLTAFIAVDKCTLENGCMKVAQERKIMSLTHALRSSVARTKPGASSTLWWAARRALTWTA